MEINQNLASVLNDLVRINNDRIEGYQKSIKEAGDKDVDLKAIFSRMADESRRYISELSHEVYELGKEPATATTTASGKIYRAWMDVKAAFTGHDRLALLESCEHGEDAAQKAYQEALMSDETLSVEMRQMIEKQKESLKVSHDTIKKFRDMHKKADSDDIVNSDSLRSSESDLRNDKLLTGANS